MASSINERLDALEARATKAETKAKKQTGELVAQDVKIKRLESAVLGETPTEDEKEQDK
jgi:ribosomal protein L18